ncbi:MAG TPA: hypothetical protein VHW01_01150 [Polyangiaceae bacterium]|nr:hypothetical protein [Polyangiaceae bacterium]
MLDRARATTLRALGKPGRRYLNDRTARVALYGSFGITSAFGLTAALPLWLMGLGPILFGVPHLLADIRYLVVRPGLHLRRGFWLLVAAPLAMLVLWPHASIAFVPVLGAAVLARGSGLRRLLVLTLVLPLIFCAARTGRGADVLMAHVHNLVALGLWWAWHQGRAGARFIPLALFAACIALLLGGTFDAVFQSAVARSGPGVTLFEMVETLSPVRDLAWGRRFVLVFAFAQSVHYAIWVRLIPEEDRPRPGLRSFDSSFRALIADLGPVLPLGCALCIGALVAWACVEPRAARQAYLQLALFHGPLEIAVVGLLFIERSQLKRT